MASNMGLKSSACKEVGESLFKLLASTYALYLKTQSYHWNIRGQNFSELHLLFEKMYEDLAESIDEIAERIRSLENFVDATFASFQKASIVQFTKPALDSKKMVKELLEDREAICSTFRESIHRFQDLLDDVSADLVIRQFAQHEKAAWMLRSYL
jgi:starvation-inducible DNA-binding protein